MRPCGGAGRAGSALALTAHTLLCGGLLPCTADPSRPAEAWWLAERLRGPEGETVRGRDGAPSVRTPSLAIREGALGYRSPSRCPSRVRSGHRGDCQSTWAEQNSPALRGRGGSWVRRPRGGAVCRSLPTAARASPLRVGGGSRWAPPGVRQVGGRVRAAGPRGVSPGGRGAVSGRDARSASASPAPPAGGEEGPVAPALAA